MGLSLSKRYKNEIGLVLNIIKRNFVSSIISDYRNCIRRFYDFSYNESTFSLYLNWLSLSKTDITEFSVYELNKKVYIGLDLSKIRSEYFDFRSLNRGTYDAENIFDGYAENEVDNCTMSCIYYMLEYDCLRREKTSKFDIVPFEICKEYGLAQIDTGGKRVYKVDDLTFLFNMVANLYYNKKRLQDLDCWNKVYKCVDSIVNDSCLVLRKGYFKDISNRKFLPVCEIDFSKDTVRACVDFQNDSANLKKFDFSDFVRKGDGYGYYLPMYACVMWDGDKHYADGTVYRV